MARKKRSSTTSITARTNAKRLKRQERQNAELDAGDIRWVKLAGLKMSAMKVLNNHRERPYWLSIPHSSGDGIEPVSPYVPCSSFRTDDRVYYGYLFREHREATVDQWDDARREMTENAMNAIRRK